MASSPSFLPTKVSPARSKHEKARNITSSITASGLGPKELRRAPHRSSPPPDLKQILKRHTGDTIVLPPKYKSDPARPFHFVGSHSLNHLLFVTLVGFGKRLALYNSKNACIDEGE